MASLSYADLGKRNNANKFCDKVFGRKGKDGRPNENNWNTSKASDGGLFFSEAVIIGGTKYTKYDKNQPVILTSAAKNPGIYLIGRFENGKKTKKEINVTKLFKSDEFGGQGAKGNAGHQFERELDRRLKECLNARCCKGEYDDESKNLLQILGKHMGSAVHTVDLVGGANTSRPIKVASKKPYIEPKQPGKHGALLTDITAKHANGHESYLSLKTSKTITFINSGVSKNFFVAREMMKGQVSSQDGIDLLEAFGLNNALFCKVFNKYNSGEQFPTENVTKHVDKQKLSLFMQTAIGANYHMVHALGGKVYYWWVGERENKKFANISTSKMIAYYGGKSGKGKRIDVEFSNEYYDFKMNIRNKQSGVYPSHIMLDYTSKDFSGKKTL